jgi:tetratricopeptide (TPR) repeat protein
MELTFATGDPEEATGYAEQALALFRALGDHWGISAIQYHLGLALHRFGQLAQALAAYDGALAEGRRVGLANTVQFALAFMGHVVLLQGDVERAERDFAESHVVAGVLGADGNPVAALGEALLARQRGDLATARAHYGRALAMPAASQKPEWTAAALTGLGFVAELAGDLDAAESAHRRAWQVASGPAATGAAAAVAAVALEGLANVAAARGAASAAASLLGTAAHWRTARRCPANRAEQHDIDRAAGRARDLLGDEAYQAGYATVSVSPDQLFADLSIPSHRG